MPVDLTLGPAGAPGTEVSLEQDGGAHVRRSVLPGGIRVLTEVMPGVRSASVGAWVAVGSRDEQDGHLGSTHFLEHLLFKGTRRRDAMDIAEAFDAVGGEANATTGKEHTCYYARMLDADLPTAVDVIADMVTSALLDPEEFETERGVILEELAMNDDDPSDVVHEQFNRAVLRRPPVGPADRRHARHHPRRPPRRRLGALPAHLRPARAGGHRGRLRRPRRALRPGARRRADGWLAAAGRRGAGLPA